MFRLNSEYTAELTGDTVTVGCQKFPAALVLQLAEEVRKLQ